MSAKEKFNEFRKLCKEGLRLRLKLTEANKLDEIRERIAEAYEEFLQELPEDRRNDTLVILSSKAHPHNIIPRTEIPRLIREDDKFFEIVLKVYGR